jgi:hypothetical protein
MNAMSARPQPVVRRHLDIEISDASGRHQPPPRYAPGEARLFGPKDDAAYATMNTVGTDHQISFGRRTIVEAHRHPVAALLQADQPVADMQSSRRQGVSQQVSQVSAAKVIVGRAELCLDRGTERRPLQGSAIVPAPLMHREGAHADGVHCRIKPELSQQPGGVGADLDAGPNFDDARRLLIDVDIEPDLQKVQRGGESADASADHSDLETHASGFRSTCWTAEVG